MVSFFEVMLSAQFQSRLLQLTILAAWGKPFLGLPYLIFPDVVDFQPSAGVRERPFPKRCKKVLKTDSSLLGWCRVIFAISVQRYGFIRESPTSHQHPRAHDNSVVPSTLNLSAARSPDQNPVLSTGSTPWDASCASSSLVLTSNDYYQGANLSPGHSVQWLLVLYPFGKAFVQAVAHFPPCTFPVTFPVTL